MYRLAILAWLLAQVGAPSSTLPQLRIEAPLELTAVRTRLMSIDQRRLAGIAQLVGIADVGAVIQVVLATESSDLAHGVSPWVSGFAVGASDLVVIFPARSPGYPDDTLEDVLRHEVAHVLIWRASAGRPVPRWFNEGLAMAAERDRGFEDQTQLLYQLVTGSRTTLDQLNHLFLGRQHDQTRAYALAGALVHEVIRQHGPAACGEILLRIRQGISFDAAFTEMTGSTPDEWESRFWQRQRIWLWVPIVTSSTILWIVVTLLAILAIYRRRQRNRQLEEQWANEEEDESEP